MTITNKFGIISLTAYTIWIYMITPYVPQPTPPSFQLLTKYTWTFIILTTVAVDGKLTLLSDGFISDVSRKRRLLALFLFTWDSSSSRSESSEEDSDTLENLDRDMMLACLLVNRACALFVWKWSSIAARDSATLYQFRFVSFPVSHSGFYNLPIAQQT